MTSIKTIARWELQNAVRTKWVAGGGIAFALSAVGVVLLGMRSVGELGLSGIGPAATSLLSVAMLLPPLIALLLGAGAIAGGRERGTLQMMLVQPGTRKTYVAGAFLGLTMAMWLMLAIGLGAAAVVLVAVADAGDLRTLSGVAVGTFTAATACVSIGIFISSFCATRSQATAWSVVVWFFFGIGADLFLLSIVPALDIGNGGVLAAILVNPVETARTLALLVIDPELGALGPFGAFVSWDLGAGVGMMMLTTAVVTWTVGAAGAAHLRTRRLDF